VKGASGATSYLRRKRRFLLRAKVVLLLVMAALTAIMVAMATAGSAGAGIIAEPKIKACVKADFNPPFCAPPPK
jgi:hypothetical protein